MVAQGGNGDAALPTLAYPLHPYMISACLQADLKKRIESLIDREYLERDESDTQIYNCLA